MSTQPHHRWRLSVDRRRGAKDLTAIRQHLQAWLPGIQDLECRWFSPMDSEKLPDQGAFRDFIPLVDLAHTHIEPLEYIRDEVIDLFGWRIDIHPVRDEN